MRSLGASLAAPRAPASPGPEDGFDAGAIGAVDRLLERAAAARASDVHLEPSRSGGAVRLRVDGVLVAGPALTAARYEAAVSRLKLLAGMDIADRRRPQDGRYSVAIGAQEFDVRVASLPAIDGEKLVLRLHDRGACAPRPATLGMSAHMLAAFEREIRRPSGFIVVAGPTGSGKTTTMYAALGSLDVARRNVCTIEDPVEQRLPGVTQVQVNPRALLTFASVLRAMLRQDPNVIMIGELRDGETAQLAGSAALSGQLVLATLHAVDAVRAVARLLDLGVAREVLAAGLNAIVAQRLVRRACSACAAQVQPESGCKGCGGSGFDGRVALFEVLPLDDAMRDAIAAGAQAGQLRAQARAAGMQTLLADGERRVRRGDTVRAELQRVLDCEPPE